MKRRNITFTTILLVLGYVCLCPSTRAVVPPPDGGYRNHNTAEGDHALYGLTIGFGNTALGFEALLSNTTGNFNVATGHHALVSNTTGQDNTATGTGALFSNTTGSANTAAGETALNYNTTGQNNTATGFDALLHNTTGSYDTANGSYALFLNTTGDLNTANGVAALYSNTTGTFNTATGGDALTQNTSGVYNTATGNAALFNNATGHGNTANGVTALYDNDGSDNTATGVEALTFNTTGSSNTADGVDALAFNTTGAGNTAGGFQALLNNTTGSSNIALGYNAGSNLTTGSNNIDIGNSGVEAEANTIRIGTTETQTNAFIAGIRGASTANADAIPVVIDSAGQLGTASSSKRFKKDICPMDKASEAILALRPVTFHYNNDVKGFPQFGLIAEEVAEVNPDLVVRDENGEIYTVRYDAVNAMLLNEFLKEHKRVEDQAREIQEEKGTISELKKGLGTVIAQLKDQASQIQNVSAQLETSKPASKVVVNNQ